MTFSSPDKENRNPSADDKDDDNIVRIKPLLKHANPELVILPSASTLIMYKNRLKQEPGFDQSMFEWMLQEAERSNLPDEGMTGGLIF
ncbi:hypothetical protein MAR_020146 [Mya arenaria]|uniref:Uncharacterized protein n=1 Tax=Mya arenaria TaxID=6604 RepID=A0ABY7E437_MYAAR|nr:hypothetical protein MAR_020146 [Mya arenaria]